ncbi:MAG TPA: LysM peptidoglycan-binding domain-containing protein [Clostridia bacterium]|nr:LysM peptidoglycan-binding domain-containing protein [Clostridia bacterium]
MTVVSGPGFSTELAWPGSTLSDYACVVRNPYAHLLIKDGYVVGDPNFVVLQDAAALKAGAFARFPFFTPRPTTIGLLVGHAAANGGSVQKLFLADVETGKHLLIPIADGRMPSWLERTNHLLSSAGLNSSSNFRPVALTNRLAWAPRTVQPGDTLYSLARKFGVTRQQIQAANPEIEWEKLQAGRTILIPGYGWSLSESTNSSVFAAHKQLGLSVQLVNENASATPDPDARVTNEISGSALKLLSWQPERDNLWSLTYLAGAPGAFPTFEVIRKALINVRTREVLADEVFKYETDGNGFVPDAPK